ncbi:unnamed protein product, partial [Rotaria sordida]
MLFGQQLLGIQTIQELRKEINQYWQSQPVSLILPTLQQGESVTTAATTTTSTPQLPESKDQFRKWFITELQRHWDILLNKLTMSQMEDTQTDEQKNSKELARQEGEKFLRAAHVTDEIMENLGNLKNGIMIFTGFQLQQQGEPKNKRRKKDVNKFDDEEKCRNKWFTERQLQQRIDYEDLATRKELAKWIDA